MAARKILLIILPVFLVSCIDFGTRIQGDVSVRCSGLVTVTDLSDNSLVKIEGAVVQLVLNSPSSDDMRIILETHTSQHGQYFLEYTFKGEDYSKAYVVCTTDYGWQAACLI